jgi:PIN like domain
MIRSPVSEASGGCSGACGRYERMAATVHKDNGTPENVAKQVETAASLRQVFPGHFRPTPEEFDRLWEEGMFVVDTNVLLNLYRYSRSTRDELLRVLRALAEKIFLPHQVGQEFLDRRLGTIRRQREGFAKLGGRVTSVREEMEEELRKVLRLRTGEDFPEGLRDALTEVPSGGYEALSERLTSLETELPQASNTPDDDEVWTAVEELVEGKVGPPYQKEERRKVKEEAERRKDAKIPPGFKDQRPGDYVLWSQTINEAKRSKRPVVLVTDDRKEDWWWIEEGATIGPRPELVAELRKEAGVLFYMYTPDRLMGEARERLNVKVSDESISEAEGFGREPGDDTTSETIYSLFGPWETSSDDDLLFLYGFLMEEFQGDPDIDRVAEWLGTSRASAIDFLDRARKLLRHADADTREPYASRSEEAGPHNIRRIAGRHNHPVSTGKLFADRFLLTVKGTGKKVLNFNRALRNRLPELKKLQPTFGDSAYNDFFLEVTFRSPVPADDTTRAFNDVARATGVSLESVGYSPTHIE